VPAKNNLARDADGLAFRIEGVNVASPTGPLETSRVAWEREPVSITADELMESEKPARVSAVDTAADWLRKTLADGAVSSHNICARAEAAGITTSTLNRAKTRLGIKSAKASMADGWSWSLPPKMLKNAEDAQGEKLSTFEQVEHLRDFTEVEIEL
jgi:hypothetical protein